ncbi:MAG TPA: DUF1152 domain-containing protein [Stellaceae bacterium]|nr:DUF1152 domain-containing protein [Stellaceae bacterium]
MLPFLDRLRDAKQILIAGCGGGFDVYCGVPLARYLASMGKRIVFANLSFTNLWMCGGERIGADLWRVDLRSDEIPYFPEKWLGEWLSARDAAAPIYAFGKTGVRPLAEAYRTVLERHAIDQVVLVDGGTDSLIFGDEPGLGTVVEDAVSLVAATKASEQSVLLAAIGFGIDHFHGISHHSFLENAARLSREGGFLGTLGLTPGTAEASAFLDLVDYANQRQPQHRSIVCNSIASALRGEFGNAHTTGRTSGSELFINPLMTQYWAFDGRAVVRHMAFADALAGTDSLSQAALAIETSRESLELRPRQPLPL